MRPEGRNATCDALLATSHLFRLGMLAQANDSLVTIVDGLSELFSDASFACASEIGPLLHEVVQAQERGDVIRLADLLEFELLPRVAG